jgi:DNA-binding MarR family transcriptional regulator
MDPDDRRRVTVEATQKARDLEEAIFGPLLARVADLLQRFSADELALIRHFLQRVRDAVSAAGTEGGT